MPDPVVVLPRADDVPETPDSLGDRGAIVWQRLWTFAAAWISPSTDIEIVTRYAETIDQRNSIVAIISAEGLQSIGSKGQTIMHPALRELRAVDASLLQMERALGLTPQDRSRLGLAEVSRKEKTTKLASFLASSE